MSRLRSIPTPILLALCALLVGFLYIGPPLAIKANFEKAGKPFVLSQFKTYRNSLLQYLGRAKEVYDGHFPPSDLSNYSGTDKPTVMNVIPSKIFSSLIGIFGGNIDAAYLAAQFLFSGLIFLAFYFAVRTLTGSRGWGIFAGFLGTLTPIATLLPFYDWRTWNDFLAYFIKNFWPLTQTQFDKLYLHLIDNPLLTYPFYLTAIAMLYRFWQKPGRRNAVLAGLSVGVLFYIYFHFWVYGVILCGLMLLAFLLTERTSREKFVHYATFLGVLAVVAIPYFVNYFRFNALAGAEDYSFRLGIAHGRIFGIGQWNLKDIVFYGLLALAIYFLYWKKGDSDSKRRGSFFWILLAGMVVAWNIQLVIGYVPVPHTWFKAFSPVIFLILFSVASAIAARLSANNVKLAKNIALLLIIGSALLVSKKIHNVYAISSAMQPHLSEYYAFPKDIADSWNWINANLSGEPKVVSPSTMTSFYLNAFTSARPYLPTGFTTLMPMPEIERHLLTAHKLFGTSRENLSKGLKGEFLLDCDGYDCFPDLESGLNDEAWHLYGNYYVSKYGNFRSFLSEPGWDRIRSIIRDGNDRLLADYSKLKADWRATGAEYVYSGPWEKAFGGSDLGKDTRLQLVYKSLTVAIYKIK